MTFKDGTAKKNKNIEYDLLNEISEQKEKLCAAAERVRRCSCDRGYIVTIRMDGDREYKVVRECECHKEWAECYRELWELAEKLAKVTGRDCSLHITPAMNDLAAHTDKPLTDEQKKAAKARLSQITREVG